MNLLYLLNDNYYSHNEGNGILLNSKYDIKYDSTNRKLSIKRNDDYIDRFWGKNIYDAMVVVGENGSGKTEQAVPFMLTYWKNICLVQSRIDCLNFKNFPVYPTQGKNKRT